ncbi:hypothetical protein [Kineococcus terrestris]|uniref:hypothetical protein n=1 Tax=Kineococcus terrestris TaxID=2044856 RepID=UPI0034DAC107
MDEYARKDLEGDLQWHVEHFDFISDTDLRARLGEEFFAARYLYKLWEGLRLHDAWAARAQVQLQVQQYASIYEACVHHLLFTEAAGSPVVEALTAYETLVERPLPQRLMDKIRALPNDDAHLVVGAVRRRRSLDISKVRFDQKVAAAVQLGIIDQPLADDLVEFYSARNLIHIHAEMKRASERSWEIELSQRAYRRLQPFKAQVVIWLERRSASR